MNTRKDLDMSREKDKVKSFPNGKVRAYEQAYRQLARQLGSLGYILKGSVQLRSLECGHAACRCHRGPRFRHGPYYWWTSKLDGKTVTWVLSKEEGRLYLGWARNRQRLDKIVEEMYRVSAKIAQARTGKLPPSLRRK
jgi:hypothetical protein